MKRNYYMSGQFLIQIAIGIYFFMSGLVGLIGYNSGANQLVNDLSKMMGKSNYLPLIILICFLLAGLILFTGTIFTVKNKILYFVILVMWIIYLILTYFTDDFLKPDLLVWIKELSLQLIILAGLIGSVFNR